MEALRSIYNNDVDNNKEIYNYQEIKEFTEAIEVDCNVQAKHRH